MPAAKREILDGEMIFLSLVDAGANMAEIIMKDAAGRPMQRIEAVAKLDKQGLLHTLVYGPDVVDNHGDFARRDAVQKLAHKFIPNMVGSGIDVMHNCKPVDPNDAHICESFIIQKIGDDRFRGVKLNGRTIDDTTELDGWWASVIKLNAAHLRAPFENGDWTGVSMYGPALVAPVAKKFDFTRALADRLGITTPKETDMNPEELAKAIAAALAPVVDEVKALTKRLDGKTTAEPTPTVEKQEVPVFDGDPDNLEEVDAYEEVLFRAKLDFSNEKDLGKWKAHLKKKAETEAASKAKATESESDELKKAKADADAAGRKVVELQKASNQGSDDVKTSETDTDRRTRIRKMAKETAKSVLRDQGRLPPKE